MLVTLPAAALLLITGCAAQPTSTAAQPPSSTPPAPAGYACSTAHIFTGPIGAAVDQQVTLGDTTAVLTGTSASDGVEPSELRDGLLTITRSGRTSVALPITPPTSVPIVDLFTLETQSEHASTDDETAGSLCLARFADGAAPVALLALTAGGVHCCVTVRAVSAEGGPPVDRAFGNYAPWLRNVSGGSTTVPVLVTADNAFANQFASFAGSGPPIQLLAWTGSALADVTRQHPDLVADDAQSFLALFDDASHPEKLGSLAGYLADECMVGNAATAWSFIDRQRQLGRLVDPTDPASALAVVGYEPALRDFVVAHGYCPHDMGETASQASSPA